jgi:hypothetical protein
MPFFTLHHRYAVLESKPKTLDIDLITWKVKALQEKIVRGDVDGSAITE